MTAAHAVSAKTAETAEPEAAQRGPAADRRPARPAQRELDRVMLTRALSGTATPLAPGERRAVEQATATDLAHARVHRGAAARAAARVLGAAAFSVGSDIAVAGPPDVAVPQRLIDHELMHVAQASAGVADGAGAESQARAGPRALASPGALAAVAAGTPACAREDWLQSTPAIGSYTVPQLIDEIREISEWLDRQVAGTQETDRMMEARDLLRAELARRQRAVATADRNQGRRPRRGAAAAAPTGPDVPPPRSLTEQSSRQLTDPAEVADEVGRVMAWLQHTDLSRADRAALHAELTALAPQLGANLDQASAQRQQARVARALSPAGTDRAGTLANLRMLDSIRPYAEQPGMAYVMHEGELIVFPQQLADRVRGEVLAALTEAVRRAGDLNESTRYRMDEHMRLNYEEQPYVGFIVSLVSGEEPVEVQSRMQDHMSTSYSNIAVFRQARDRDSLARLGELALTAAEQAGEAQHVVDEGVNRAVSAAGQVVSGLEIVRDVSFAVALSIGAILAAPVVAAGVAGFGVTGLGATALTALGTGTVVGAEGYGLGFAGGAGGELAAGHGARAALRSGNTSGLHYGAQGFAIGLGGGTSFGLARNLGVGGAGLSFTSNLGRSVLAQGTGNALGSATGAFLQPPEGVDRGTAAWHAGLIGFGTGAFGAVAGAGSQQLTSPALRWGAGVALPGLADAGVTYAQTGDWRQAALSGGMSVTVGSLAHMAPREGPMEQAAFGWGRSARRGVDSAMSTGRSLLAASMLGVGELPALRMYGASGGPSLVESNPIVSSRRLGIDPETVRTATEQRPATEQAPATQQQARTEQQPATQQQPATEQRPDVGLADRGVRPAPGERTETRAQYRARRSGERWGAAVDEFLATMTDQAEAPRVTGGQSDPRIAGTRVPGEPPARLDIENIPRRPGETQQQALARVRSVIGRRISDFPRLEALWNAARASVLSRRALTSSNYGDLYDATRGAFYRRVRNDPAAQQVLTDAGLQLSGGRSTAPTLAGTTGMRDAEIRLSLDHVLEKGQGSNWQYALDADNLEFTFAAPNSEREISQMRHPELR